MVKVLNAHCVPVFDGSLSFWVCFCCICPSCSAGIWPHLVTLAWKSLWCVTTCAKNCLFKAQNPWKLVVTCCDTPGTSTQTAVWLVDSGIQSEFWSLWHARWRYSTVGLVYGK
jgi:hypothetical protein